MALSSPYPLFEGHLAFKRERSVHKDPELLALARYLKNLKKRGELDFDFDVSSFSFDVGQGLFFDSSIPQGYGVGSSGALCAALYDRYAPTFQISDDINELKRRLAVMESHFHGSSSGLDPLISYLEKPILVSSEGNIDVVDIPQTSKEKGTLFLLNTGRSRKTEPLVNLFLEKCKNPEFNTFCKESLLPVTNQCIDRFLKGDIDKLQSYFKELSRIQLEEFTPMIPKLYHDVWRKGLESNTYQLKLCGAGGGGFLLGLTTNFKETALELEEYEVRPLFLAD